MKQGLSGRSDLKPKHKVDLTLKTLFNSILVQIGLCVGPSEVYWCRNVIRNRAHVAVMWCTSHFEY